MTSFLDWSTTDATNASIGSINFSNGQLPSTLNDSARVLMGDAARWRKAISSALTATGTNTLVYSSGLSLTSYVQGQFFMFKNTTESTGPVTFNVDSISAKSVVKHGDVALTAADLKANGIYVVAFESVNDRFQLLSPVSNQSATLSGAETLTNKTITSAVLNGTLSGSSLLDDDSMASATATTVASSESVKAYVDAVAVTTAAAITASEAAALVSKNAAAASVAAALVSENAVAADLVLTNADVVTTGNKVTAAGVSEANAAASAVAAAAAAAGVDPQLGFKNVSSWADSAVETVTLNPAASAIGKADVSVWEEIPDANKTNSVWDIVTNELGFDLVDSAASTTLTPAATTGDSIAFTMGAGTFASTDIGKRIVNVSASEAGEARIISIASAVATCVITTTFSNTDAIASGDWKMYSGEYVNGAFEVSNATIPGGFGTEKVVEAATTGHTSITTLSETKALMCYRDGGNSDNATAVVLTIANRVITVGTPLVFNTGYWNIGRVVGLTSTKAIACFSDGNDTNKVKAYVLSVSGTTVTAGSVLTVDGGGNQSYVRVTRMSDTTALVIWKDSSSDGASAFLTISGTSVSKGTTFVFEAGTIYQCDVSSMSSTTAIVVFRDDSGTQILASRFLTVSGTTITTGAKLQFSGGTIGDCRVQSISATKAICCYSDTYNVSHRATVVILSVSGTTVSAGTIVRVNNTYFAYQMDIAVISETEALFVFTEAYTNVNYSILTISGTDITAGTIVDDYIVGHADELEIALLTSTKFISGYRDSGNSNYATSEVLDLEAALYVTNQYVTTISGSDSIDSTFYADWNSTAVTETLNGQTALYAFSTNSTPSAQEITGGTFGIIKSGQSAVRKIASSLNSVHGGTNTVWFINTNATYGSETWAAAATNEAKAAIQQASAVTANQMSGTEFAGISDANLPAFGTQLSLAITLKSTDSTATPSVDKVLFNYDANVIIRDETDQYIIEMPATNTIRVTAPSSGTSRNARIYVSK